MSSFILVLIISAIIIPVYNKTEVTEAATGTAKESSLSFNLTNSTASVDLSINDINGTFASSSDDNSKVKFNISTTNYTGYTLSIKGINNNQTLVNGTNSSYTLSSISTATESFNSTDYNNTWGYLPSKLNSSTNTNYLPAPTVTASTLDKTSSPNLTANSYTIGIGARATYSTPAGAYSGTYTLTVVGNPINYTVTYNKNTTDTVASLPNSVNSSTSETNVSLSSAEPTRDGYTFVGWCDTATINTNGDDECSGTTYEAGDDYGIDQTTTNDATLYAMWEESYDLVMQEVTSSNCTTTAQKAKDIRDGTIYTVQKLADYKCWLLDNLALDLVTYRDTLNSSNTNATDEQLAYLKGASTGATSDQYATSGVTNWPSSVNSFSVPYQQTAYKNATGGGYASGKYGVYYNFCAASAGTYCYGDGTSSGSPSGNAYADICPYGWKIPTGGRQGQQASLYAYTGSAQAFRNALHVSFSGSYNGDGAYGQGSRFSFWSSTYYTETYMYGLTATSSLVWTTESFSLAMGYPIRCILK